MIIPVHLYGHPVDIPSLRTLAERQGLFLLEDAAQAHGAEIGKRPVGALGGAAGFSFYPAKNLGAFGDGGAITTDDEMDWPRMHDVFVTTARGESTSSSSRGGQLPSEMPLQAAFLRTKLRVLSAWNAQRSQVAERYLGGLAALPDVTLPPSGSSDVKPAWHIFCIRHPRRDALRTHLDARSIETLVHYPTPPHLSPAFAHLGFSKGSFPVTEAVAATVVSLPLGPHLKDSAVTKVIEGVASFVTGAP